MFVNILWISYVYVNLLIYFYECVELDIREFARVMFVLRYEDVWFRFVVMVSYPVLIRKKATLDYIPPFPKYFKEHIRGY